MRCARTALIATLGGLVVAAGPFHAVPAAADPPPMIDCGDTYTEGSRLEISCHNPDSAPGTVDLMYVCSTPLDFGRRIVFNEPGFTVGAGATLRLTRDCGAEQVVVTHQLWTLTAEQRADNDARIAGIRERRDRATPR
ncbi:hypothetical protein JK358_31510 [Nocardia sp. 2]|uniref:Secreted protein n=1 Tax=Nocardia acididurans TaxID=2802282 RepID=A0ABS1MEG5_9NOCA|nr:hypothetical protein [Nocardia acididurans]MBL1078941.1 hypothetical protein [Nocardia acididurans]